MKAFIPVVALLLCGCGGADDREAAAEPAQPFDDLTETIDRAEQVEEQLQQQKERMDRALQDADKPPGS